MASAQGGAGRSLFSRLFSGLNFSFGSGGAAVGLSIGASSIKVAQLKKTKTSWKLEKFSNVPLTETPSEHREISNVVSTVQAIQQAMSEAGVSSKEVCSAITGSGIIIKALTLTIADMKELQDQVFWEAEQYIPFDISEVVIDYFVTKQGKDNQVEVILVAVKKEYLEQYMGVIEEAGLKPAIIDAEVFAIQNTYETNYPVSDTQASLLVDIGALSSKIMICSGGVPFFTKDTPFGGAAITAEIQRELKLPSMHDAESLKVSTNLPHEVSEVVARMCHVLGTELRKSIDFYSASSLGPPINSILLSGGGARAAHLSKIIEDNTGVPTQLLNPFLRIEVDSKKFSDDYLSSIACEAVVPIGLAIRAGDKK